MLIFEISEKHSLLTPKKSHYGAIAPSRHYVITLCVVVVVCVCVSCVVYCHVFDFLKVKQK